MSNINIIEAVRFYINRMLDDCGHCMKGLIMDNETKSIVSMVYAQSDILQKEVFLFERIDTVAQKSLKHLNAICFLRPTEENIQALEHELNKPKYSKYFIYFSNFVELNDIKKLAEADKFECIQVVQEFYADYLAINPHLYSLNIPITSSGKYEWNDILLHRTVQGLISLLLSLRRKSAIIRYQKSSTMAKILAERLSSKLKRQADFSSTNASDTNQTIVLIVDRREDPITPLLNQWTYQAMVHELIGIKNNRVSLTQVPGITKELEEVVLNAEYDKFYADNLYKDFAEIAKNVIVLTKDFKQKHKSQSELETLTDMKTFVENYPEFKKLSGSAFKHVTVISELSRLIDLYNLLAVSETEQNLVCQNNHNEIVQQIKDLIKNNKVRDEDILRLLCLYALRYESHANNELNTFKYEAQKHRRLPEKYIHFFHALLDYGGQKIRQDDLFNTQKSSKQFMRGLKTVENVHMQHVPLIKDLLEQLLRGKLKDTLYPSIFVNDQIKQYNLYSTNQQNQLQQQGQVIKPSEIIVYMIGGVTYEESFHIHMMNNQNARIILGGSYIHNFLSFMDEVLAGSTSHLSTAYNELFSSKRH